MEKCILLGKGNPGALTALKKLLELPQETIDMILTKLENNNITGSDIWLIYKHCKQDINLFILYDFDNYFLYK